MTNVLAQSVAAPAMRTCRLAGPAPCTRPARLVRCRASGEDGEGRNIAQKIAEKANVSLGPIGLTLGGDLGEQADGKTGQMGAAEKQGAVRGGDGEEWRPQSIAELTTEEWRAKYERDGAVPLFIDDQFSAASRLSGGRAAHAGFYEGWGDGEGLGVSDAPRHKVEITNNFTGQVIEVDVPEDRFILMEAEDAGLELPYACRMGCCTACAVRVTEGEVYQPYALGVSKKLKEQGYALMCVSVPLENCKMETVEEDEIYMEQFGNAFREMATNPNDARFVERDDYALEIALGDE
ncbi:unnamed protein product [Pedinophyceae sp. YPF-701]|nr:unnamed protein product [Pedinophyceae sp. YPF-701]